MKNHNKSERKSQSELARMVEQLSIIQRIARIGTWQTSLGDGVLRWSDETYRIFGVEPDQLPLTSQSFLELVHPDDRALLLDERARALRGEKPYDVEHRIVRPDGEIRFVHERAEIIFNAQGEPMEMTGTVQDVTERQRMETDLRHSEERFRRLFAGAAAGIAVTDINGRFLQVNPAYTSILGYTEEELLGLTNMEIIHPDDRHAHRELMQQLLAGEREHFILEKRYIRKDGNIAWGRVSVSLINTPNGEPLNRIAVVEDITEGKLAQAAASTLAQQLAETLENMTDAFYLLDENWQFIYLNRQAEKVLRVQRQEVEGRSIWEMFPDARNTILKAEYEQAVATDKVAHFEFFFPPLEEWFEVHAHPSVQGLAVYFRAVTARHQAEAALRETQARFLELAEAINDVFWIRDAASGRILYTNPRYAEIFGSPPEALYADPSNFERYIHPDDLPGLHAALAADRYNVDVVFRVHPPGHKLRHIHVCTFPIFDEDGTVVRSVGLARDVSAQVEADERLRASEEQYRLLFENNPNPMWVFEQETWRFLAVNKAAVEHYGYTEDEFLRMTLRDIRDPQRLPELQRFMEESPDGEFSGVTQHLKKDGTRIDVQLRTNRLLFDGREARLVLINDVTTQLQAQARIREQAALLDKAGDAILVRDLEHRITFWNQGAAQLYGWSAQEAIGQRIDDLLYSDPAEFYTATHRTIKQGEWHGELRQVSRNGDDILVDARWTLVRDDRGEPYAILAINADITERKRLEAQFLRAQRMESIGTLAGGIAHDLNNALTPILLSASLLRQHPRTDDELKLINMIEDNAKRGADMVRQVLSFARGVDGQRIPVNLGATLHEVITLLRDTLDKNIKIALAVNDGVHPVMGDPTQLHQVIMNLCVNARDAMPNGGTLDLHVEDVHLDQQYVSMNPQARVGHYTLITVSDTGTGIPVTIRERIFDPFFTTKSVGKGTGLGLSTTQAIVKSHSGFISLYTEERRGTIFRVYLPAHIQSEPMGGALQSKDRLPKGRGELILVVDDEASVRRITQQTLESYGYRALTAEDGAEALVLYAQHRAKIAVVITDMMMPIMDGYATIQALLRMNPDVRIIAASGLAENGFIAKAASAGVRHFLQKPYTSEALLKKLHTVLGADETAQ